MKTFMVMAGLLLTSGICFCAEVSTFHAYVDSDLCARLMPGPINSSRIEWTLKTYKEGSNPVLVRLNDNTVFDVNKQKMLKDHVGKYAEVTGKANVKSGTMKLESVTPEQASNIPKGDPAHRLLDVRLSRAKDSASLFEKVRHELAMLPYVTVFDFISFTMIDHEVILTGWTVRQTNRHDAYGVVKHIEGIEKIVNNIEVLPLGSFDNDIRVNARAKLQRFLSRYFWGSGSDIKIVVKNGKIILLGTVATKADSDIATIQCRSVPMAFQVFNLLRVRSSAEKQTD